LINPEPSRSFYGQNFFDTLVMLAEGRPWLPATRNHVAVT